MNRTSLTFALATLLAGAAGNAIACDYTAGETRFLEYANCRYGEDMVMVVDLPDGSAWEHCIYYVEAFRPEKLLAVTKEVGGEEVLSVNDRAQIGNPCYLTKRACDTALRSSKSGMH